MGRFLQKTLAGILAIPLSASLAFGDISKSTGEEIIHDELTKAYPLAIQNHEVFFGNQTLIFASAARQQEHPELCLPLLAFDYIAGADSTLKSQIPGTGYTNISSRADSTSVRQAVRDGVENYCPGEVVSTPEEMQNYSWGRIKTTYK